jgi:hypothetical protein
MTALILIAVGRIVSTYRVFSTTADEPDHLACGLEYLSKHTYTLETQHPPLTRVFVALLPYLSGTRTQGKDSFRTEGWADITYERHPEATVTRMRIGNLPFFVLGCVIVYLWSKRYFGAAAAVLATFVFTMIPTVLAHAGQATTDMGLAACLGAAFYAMLVWVERPSMVRGAMFGFALSLAMLAKFTTLGFFPCACGIALLGYLAAGWPGWAGLWRMTHDRLPSLGVAAAVCCATIWAVYFLSFGSVPEWNVKLPAWQYFDGIRVALEHNRLGHPSYLLGEVSDFGWWYYFPVALGVKSPLALLLLVPVGLAMCWRNRRSVPYLLPSAFALGVLLPAMAGNVNIGLRHILPVYMGLSILAALGLMQLSRIADTRKWAGGAAIVLCLWLAATGAIHHPDYIPYFNELAGKQPDRILCDSDFDWGQDNKRLALRLKQLGATQVNFDYVGATDIEYFQTYPGLPPITPINPTVPAEGWTVISPTLDRSFQYGLFHRYPNLRPWYSDLPVLEHVGTLDLTYRPPGSAK